MQKLTFPYLENPELSKVLPFRSFNAQGWSGFIAIHASPAARKSAFLTFGSLPFSHLPYPKPLQI